MLDAARQRGEEIGVSSVAPATGATLHWLAELIGARAVAEVGTGAGVSGLWLLRGMTSDGILTYAAYDLVFVDGNPQESSRYLEESLRLLRPGGLVLFHGALAGGKVADPAQRDPATIAVRGLVNESREDERIRPLLLPVGDGLLVAQKIDS